MTAIAVRLNAEGIAFPAKVTHRRPMRRGWAISTIHTILSFLCARIALVGGVTTGDLAEGAKKGRRGDKLSLVSLR
jgi:hypothetical protein